MINFLSQNYCVTSMQHNFNSYNSLSQIYFVPNPRQGGLYDIVMVILHTWQANKGNKQKLNIFRNCR
jgi:hypothetical protein